MLKIVIHAAFALAALCSVNASASDGATLLDVSTVRQEGEHELTRLSVSDAAPIYYISRTMFPVACTSTEAESSNGDCPKSFGATRSLLI